MNENAREINPASAPDGIVILRCADSLRLTKTISPAGISSYGRARYFDAFERPISDLCDLHATLRVAADQPTFCAVRGGLYAGQAADHIRRLLRPDPNTLEPATIFDKPRRWLALDVDGIALPRTIDKRDLKECAAHVIPQLPDAFHGVWCIVQATSSHTLKPGARLRLWYWLDQPLTGAECKRWLKNSPVDSSVFVPTEPIYIASPVFVDGAVDPLVTRLEMIVEKRITIATPSLAELAPPTPPPPCERVVRVSGGMLEGLVRRVANAAKGERNRITYWAACRLGESVAHGDMAAEYAETLIAEAAKLAGLTANEALATARSGLAAGQGASQ